MATDQKGIDEAKQAAWRAALAISRDHRNVAATTFRLAEMTVIRQQIASMMPGGERRYWELVEQELRSEEKLG